MNSTLTFRPRSIDSVSTLALFAFCASILYASATSIAHADGSGWFTQVQADRGRVAYGPNCGTCHGDALQGTGAPAGIDQLTESVSQPSGAGPTQAELNAADIAETHWLMYNKGSSGERYSSLRQIALHGTARVADPEDSAYVIQQDHAAPVTVTESPDHPTEQSTGEIRKSPEEGSESHSSGTASEATSSEDRKQTAEQYASRRQKMIEHCELNYGIDCVREVDIELGAEALYRDHVVHLMRPMGGMR